MKILLSVCLFFLGGCSLFSASGVAEFDLTPVYDDSGKLVSARVKTNNTKDYESRKIEITAKPDGSFSAKIEEKGVSSSDPVIATAQSNAAIAETLRNVTSLVQGK